jgi:hypothetical protein
MTGEYAERVEEMRCAVEKLPANLIELGRSYDYPQLHRACVDGELELVKGLLDVGLSADAYTYTNDEGDWPPLRWLAEAEDMDAKLKIKVAKLLLKKGACIDEGDALEAAEDADDESFAAFLAAAGATSI